MVMHLTILTMVHIWAPETMMMKFKMQKKLIQLEWESIDAISLVLFTSAIYRHNPFSHYLKIISKITTSSSRKTLLLCGNSPSRSPRLSTRKALTLKTEEHVLSKSDFLNLITMKTLQQSNSLDSKATPIASKIKSQTSKRPLPSESLFDGKQPTL